MKAFAVRDKAMLGRGIFALFSTFDKAEGFLQHSTRIVRQCGEVAELTMVVKDGGDVPSTVFAVYFYDNLHDSYIFDGLYGDPALAGDIAGHKGQVVKFVIDLP